MIDGKPGTTTSGQAAEASPVLAPVNLASPEPALPPVQQRPDEPAPAVGADPADVVILVDQSRSLTPADIELEAKAVGLIAASDLLTGTRIAVVGFASAGLGNGSGRPPTDRHCDLSLVDADDGGRLADCVQRIRPRRESEGFDTDYAAALQTAHDILAEPGPASPGGGELTPRRKVVFLLTDGKLDVAGDTNATGTLKNQDARVQIEQRLLPDLAKAGVEVWPIAFGDSPSIEDPSGQAFDLTGVTRATAPHAACAAGPSQSAVPHVSKAVDLGTVLPATLAEFGCIQLGRSEYKELNRRAELSVDVPAGLSDLALTVVKPTSGTRITFKLPTGVTGTDGTGELPADGTDDGGTSYVRRGAASVVEGLRVVNPPPGVWTVVVDAAPTDRVNAPVLVVPTWSLDAQLTVDETAPSPGSDATARVHLQARQGSLTGSAFSGGIVVDVRIADIDGQPAGPPGLPPATLQDDGRHQDGEPGDGTFGGTVAVPDSATSRLGFVSRVSGQSLSQSLCGTLPSCAESTVFTGVSMAAPVITLQPLTGNVEAGGTVSGQITVDAPGPAQVTELSLGLDAPDTDVVITPELVRPIGSKPVRYTVHVPASLPAGSPVRGNVVVRGEVVVPGGNTIDPIERRIAFNLTVVSPSDWTWLVVLLAVVGGVAALTAVGYVAWRRRRRPHEDRAAVYGITAWLFTGRRTIVDFIEALDEHDLLLSFSIDYDHGGLVRATTSGDAYFQVRRSRNLVEYSPENDKSWYSIEAGQTRTINLKKSGYELRITELQRPGESSDSVPDREIVGSP